MRLWPSYLSFFDGKRDKLCPNYIPFVDLFSSGGSVFQDGQLKATLLVRHGWHVLT